MLVTAHKHLPTLRNRLSHVIRYARVCWRSLNLSGKLLVVAILPIGLNLLIMGNWVSDQVTDRVVNQEAAATALYVDSFIEPLLQDLARSDHLSPSSLTALKTLLASKPFNDRIVSF